MRITGAYGVKYQYTRPKLTFLVSYLISLYLYNGDYSVYEVNLINSLEDGNGFVRKNYNKMLTYLDI